MKYAEDGYEIQVGDVVEVVERLGLTYHRRVKRVTKTMAITRINHRAEKRYRRKVGSFGPRPVPKIEWDTNIYRVIKAADYAAIRETKEKAE